MSKKIVYIVTIVLSIIYIVVGNKITSKNSNLFNQNSENSNFLKAKVIAIIDRDVKKIGDVSSENAEEDIIITFRAELLNGEKKGELITGTQTITPLNFMNTKQLENGEKILVFLEDANNTNSWIYIERVRTDALIVLGIIFLVLLLIFGRFKGVNTILSLTFTILSIFLVFIPAILSGYNIYFWSIITCVFIILSTLIIVYGVNKKSISTSLGCFGGIIVSGILIFIMDSVLSLTGIINEESVYLLYLDLPTPIDLKAIIFGSIIIGAIGAIMDVSIDISSSLKEISIKLENPTFGELIKSGLNIGRDIMGTMTNTLILAYIGSSLSTVILLTAYNNSIINLFNKEMIVIEILQALIGSIGLLFTIPLTSVVCAVLYSRKNNIQKPKL